MPPAIAIQERAVCENPNAGPDGAGIRTDGAAYTLEARTVTQAIAFHPTQDPISSEGYCHSIGSNSNATAAVLTPWAVRRLTPRECSRLMGFPDDWAKIPYRGKPAEQCPDGPQYKAYGNSWAVNCGEWIFDRIRMVEETYPASAAE